MRQPESNTCRYWATRHNGGAAAAGDIRLIVSLELEEGAIVGYGAVEWPIELAAGAVLPVGLRMTPLAAAAGMRHQAIAPARAAE